MVKKNMNITVILFMLVMAVIVGCSNEGESGEVNESGEEREPITLTLMMWDDWGQDYEKYFKEAVEDEFPHITLENVPGDAGNAEFIEEALAAGIIPDLIFAGSQYQAKTLEKYELGFDMTELIEASGFDLSKYDHSHLQEWVSWSDGEIWLLPYMREVYALHYNKEVFDILGVNYPTDGMTWEEVINLAEEVTIERDGVQYQGLNLANNTHFPLTQVLGTENLIDPDTDEVLWLDNPYVREWLELIEKVHAIPGNEFSEGEGHAWDEDRTLAMRPLWLAMGTPDDMNWDIVTYPQWDDRPGVGPIADGFALGVTAQSKHKKEAFEVLEFLFSDEHIGYLGESALHAPYLHLHEDGQSLEQLTPELRPKLEDKNLDALYQLEPVGGPEYRSRYDHGAFTSLINIGEDFIESGLDVNSYLRERKEMEEIRISEEKNRE